MIDHGRQILKVDHLFLRAIRSLLYVVFFVFLVLSGVAFSYLTPPFQAPDEPAHLFRAYQISKGNLIGTRISKKDSGGLIDSGLIEVCDKFIPYMAANAPAVSPRVYQEARSIPWRHQYINADFRNTVQYGPVAYLPQAFGLYIGERLGLPVIDCLYLARALAMAFAFLLGLLAIRVASGIKIFVFCIVALPMSVFLEISASQDGILIGLGALLAAVISRFLDGRQAVGGFWWGLAAGCIVLLSLARLPYILLTLVLFAPTLWRGNKEKIFEAPVKLGAIFSLLALFFAWNFANADVRVKPYPYNDRNISAERQIDFLIENPLKIIDIARNTIEDNASEYAYQFVGMFGWLNIRMEPKWYNATFLVMGLLLLASRPPQERRIGDMLVISGAIAITLGAMFLAQYLTWTDVGALSVDGIQGRYFLPLASLIAILVPSVFGRFLVLRVLLGAMGLFGLAVVMVHAASILRLRYDG